MAVAAAAPASASDMASFINKRAKVSGEAVTGDGDLVSDVTSGRKALDAIPDSDLPDDMRKLSLPQRQAKIDTQMSERKALNEQLSTLVAKRDALVAEKRKAAPKPASSFDAAVEATLKAQIKR
jgi:hypothetical protein